MDIKKGHRTIRCRDREPAVSRRHKWKIIGGWLPSLTFAFDHEMMKKIHKTEAEALLRRRMEDFRKRPFSELRNLIDTADTIEVKGETGKNYQIEINAVWDDMAKTRLRVCGGIDDGGLRAWCNWRPLVQDFFAFPDGRTEIGRAHV